MLRPRVIPVLLLKGRGLYKTVKFKNPTYVGDPVNTLRIFCEKEVDEVVLLDIAATPDKKEPNIEILRDIASECFMPVAYGGGIRSVDNVRAILKAGIEKVVVNTSAVETPQLITRISEYAGSSSTVVSIDVCKKLLGGYEVVIAGGKRKTGLDPVAFAQQAERLGAGEIVLNSVERDGTMVGYDIGLVERLAKAVDIPVIACGGAGSIGDLRSAIVVGAGAAAAGSMFVFQGKHRAVLISYPTPTEVDTLIAR